MCLFCALQTLDWIGSDWSQMKSRPEEVGAKEAIDLVDCGDEAAAAAQEEGEEEEEEG